jgi:uncharacterized membrane protein YagU involved in acid resistance
MPRALRTILTAGLIAGVLDIGYVFLVYGIWRGANSLKILQGIAGALIGREAATEGGLATAALGLAIHFCIALGVTAVFYALSRKLRFLVERPWVAGPLFGAAVWLVMQLVVLPLTAAPPKSFPPPQWWVVFIAHLVCVGLPIAVVVRRMEARPATA